MNRISRDEYYMKLAKDVSLRCTCERRQVGAVIVKDDRIISTGYNGAPRTLKHCIELGGCIRQKQGISSGQRLDICRAVHAEENAILNAAYHGQSTKDASLYVMISPCLGCAKSIINAGIKEVICEEKYDNPESFAMLEEAGIVVRILKEELTV